MCLRGLLSSLYSAQELRQSQVYYNFTLKLYIIIIIQENFLTGQNHSSNKMTSQILNNYTENRQKDQSACPVFPAGTTQKIVDDLRDPLFPNIFQDQAHHAAQMSLFGAPAQGIFNSYGNFPLPQNQDYLWDYPVNQQFSSLQRGNSLREVEPHVQKKFKGTENFPGQGHVIIGDTPQGGIFLNSNNLPYQHQFQSGFPVYSNLIQQSTKSFSATNTSQHLGAPLNLSTAPSENSAFLNAAANSYQVSGSTNSYGHDESSVSGNDVSQNEQANDKKTNRRAMKEEDKVAKKGDDKKNKKRDSFLIPPPPSGKGKSSSSLRDNEESHVGKNESTVDQLARLTNKKREYLDQAIVDKNGEFNYEEDPQEYKKARKRLQNRESAVRSRMRKKYHQDDLESRIDELEKSHKEISEQNAGLSAQNALLKKQLAYFEEIFAKSSLSGYDQSLSKFQLEEFQKNLLNKINQRIGHSSQEATENLDHHNKPQSNHDNSMELFPSQSQSRNILDDVDSFSTDSLSGQAANLSKQLSEERIEGHLQLVRSRSNSSSFSNSGYLFLAIVFAMMCCSSLIMSPAGLSQVASQIQSDFKGSQFQFNGFTGRTLKSHQGENSHTQNNLADKIEDEEMVSDQMLASKKKQNHKTQRIVAAIEEPQDIGAIQLVKMMIQGQYTYLTYMLLSATCFFFWMMPNFNKVRSLFSFTQQSRQQSIKSTGPSKSLTATASSSSNSEGVERHQMSTRSQTQIKRNK
ncbi:hypothetical protein FGO68_gene9689 [Halteria grandinella]|uniref:BZIP domain-containing protein n=1 Tax=Halteria grandinella TaxID=5974 RepID=A0A8J8TB08_HALGN|nr:hypothetical protein FGO68_gene9689 [Halteria grandinella]